MKLDTGNDEAMTRLVLDNLTPTIEVGDQIDVNSKAYSLVKDEAGQYEIRVEADKNGNYKAALPATTKVLNPASGSKEFLIPTEQNYRAGSFDPNANLMYAEALKATEGIEILNFKNAGGILKVSLTGTQKVTKLTLVSNNSSDKIAGFAYSITNNTHTPGTTNPVIYMNCGENGVQLSSTATDFHFVVSPGAFAAGFTLRVETSDGKYQDIKTTNPQTIVRNQIRTMPVQAVNATSTADPTAFVIPDKAFRTFCITKGYCDGFGVLDKTKAAAVKGTKWGAGLSLSGLGVTDLSGLEFFTGLININLTNNPVDKIDLSMMPNLIVVNCTSCGASEIKLPATAKLESIFLTSNKLSSIDLSAYTTAVQIKVDNNQLTNLKLPKLPELPETTKLTTLWVNKNLLTSIDITPYTMLNNFICNNNLLTTLDLSTCKAYQIQCQNNKLTSLTLPNATTAASLSSYTLNCGNNLLSTLDISTVKSLLSQLDCSGNKLTTLDVSECSSMRSTLICKDNELTSLKVPGSIQSVECQNNRLTTLDVNGYSSLKTLMCYNNRMSTLYFVNSALNGTGMGIYILECGQQTTDGTTAQNLALTIHTDSKAYWDSSLATKGTNAGVTVSTAEE